MSAPSIMIETEGNESQILLDDTVEDQLRGAVKGVQALSESKFANTKVRVTDFGELDESTLNDIEWTVEKLIKLGEAMSQHSHDPDLVCAALLAADGDLDSLDNTLDRLSWVGEVRQDEKDYAQYVLDEGLTGEKLDAYLDHEAIGRDYLADMHTTTLKDGRIIAWNG